MGSVSRAEQVCVMNTRVFWIKHELMLGLQRLDDGAIFNPTIPYLELMFPLQHEPRLFMHTPIWVGSIRIHRSHTRSRGVEAALWMICVWRSEKVTTTVWRKANYMEYLLLLVAHRCMQTRWQSKCSHLQFHTSPTLNEVRHQVRGYLLLCVVKWNMFDVRNILHLKLMCTSLG